MAGVKSTKIAGSTVRERREGVSVQLLPATARDEQVAALDHPWVAEEGPLRLRFERRQTLPELLLRGLAFDRRRTVTWDEDCVEVIEPSVPDERTVALESPVLTQDRFKDVPSLVRIDYIQDGVWRASRYVVASDAAASDAEGADHA